MWRYTFPVILYRSCCRQRIRKLQSFCTCTCKRWKFVIRVKDKNSNGIVSGLKISDKESFDKEFSFQLTRGYTKEIRTHPGKT